MGVVPRRQTVSLKSGIWDGWVTPTDRGPRAVVSIVPGDPQGPAWSPIEPQHLRCYGPCHRYPADALDAGLDLDGLSLDELRVRAIRRGRAALARQATAIDKDDPFAATLLRWAIANLPPDHPAGHPATLLAFWRTRPGGRRADYPWLPADGRPTTPAYTRSDRATRGSCRAGVVGRIGGPAMDRCGERLTGPAVLGDALELLLQLAAGDDRHVADAAAFLVDEVRPTIEGDVADLVRAEDPWRDTWGLWTLTRRPLAQEALHPLLTALASRHATLAVRTAGLVTTGPAGDLRPSVSASANLASGLWSIGQYTSLIPGLARYLRAVQDTDGAWGDRDAPPDLTTTLVAADLLSSIDPAFDPEPTVRWLARAQEPTTGWWRQLGPEVAWLTTELIAWLERSARPFAERFRWPAATRATLDRKTGLPSYAQFGEVVRAFQNLPGLAEAPVGVGFLDLARFREFNNRCGQVEGDRLLRRLADTLATIPGALAIRDGGDEFMIVGAPTRAGLADDLDTFRLAWRRVVAEEFDGYTTVAPRIVALSTRGDRLAEARERLGRAVGEVKHVRETPREGLLVTFDE
jgi:GGDEF domain-containing protein